MFRRITAKIRSYFAKTIGFPEILGGTRWIPAKLRNRPAAPPSRGTRKKTEPLPPGMRRDGRRQPFPGIAMFA